LRSSMLQSRGLLRIRSISSSALAMQQWWNHRIAFQEAVRAPTEFPIGRHL
jgi:hypothetical protein